MSSSFPVSLEVLRGHRAHRLAAQLGRFAEVPAVALRSRRLAECARATGEVVGDLLGQRWVPWLPRFREEPTLRDLGPTLLVNLRGEPLGTDLLLVEPAVLVLVPRVPDARTLRSFKDTPVSGCTA